MCGGQALGFASGTVYGGIVQLGLYPGLSDYLVRLLRDCLVGRSKLCMLYAVSRMVWCPPYTVRCTLMVYRTSCMVHCWMLCVER